MSIKECPIGFLDSGIGGVTVLREAQKLMPNEDYVFFSDSKNNPYGDKPTNEIIDRCEEICNQLVNDYSCKAIVLACNTASAQAVEHIRTIYGERIPVIAIEPAYKMVHDLNPDGFTLVMATRGTIESEKFHRLFYKYYNQKTAVLSCVGLADLIEQDRQDDLLDYLEDLLKDYKGKVENVVLGCTHYPLAKQSIQKVLGNVKFFDGSYGTSKQLMHRLEEFGILSDSNEKGKITFIDSSMKQEEKKKRFFDILAREDNVR